MRIQLHDHVCHLLAPRMDIAFKMLRMAVDGVQHTIPILGTTADLPDSTRIERGFRCDFFS